MGSETLNKEMKAHMKPIENLQQHEILSKKVAIPDKMPREYNTTLKRDRRSSSTPKRNHSINSPTDKITNIFMKKAIILLIETAKHIILP